MLQVCRLLRGGGSGLLLALGVVAATPAQALQRRPISGVVTSDQGEPVAGAEVVLAGASASPVWGPAPEVLRTRTDAAGRFLVQARDGVEYSAWSMHADRVSGMRHGVLRGPRHELVLSESVPAPLRVGGLDAWADRGPFTARWWLNGGAGLHVDVPLTATELAWPTGWPPAAHDVQVLTADGRTLFVRSVDGVTFDFPPPLVVDVVVETPDGQPIAGAELFSHYHLSDRLPELGYVRPLVDAVRGVSDAQGRCRVSWPTYWTRDEPNGLALIHARAPGHAPVVAGFGPDGRPFAEGLADGEGPDRAQTEDGALRLRLRRERPLPGRLHRAGEPLAGCPVSVTLRRDVNVGNRMSWILEESRRVITDTGGRFVVRGAGADEILGVQVRGVDAIWGDEVPRTPAPDQPRLALAPDAEKLDLDAAACARVDLQVVREGGGPAQGALLFVMSLPEKAFYLQEADLRCRLDPAGRTSLLLQRDVEWFVLVVDGTAVAHRVLELHGERSRQRIEVAELPRLRLDIVDQQGAPVAGARLRYTSYTYDRAPTAALDQLKMLAVQLYQRWIAAAQSDAGGVLELPVFDPDWTDYTVQVFAGELQSAEFRLRDLRGGRRIALR